MTKTLILIIILLVLSNVIWEVHSRSSNREWRDLCERNNNRWLDLYRNQLFRLHERVYEVERELEQLKKTLKGE